VRKANLIFNKCTTVAKSRNCIFFYQVIIVWDLICIWERDM
jgi:hypothetical protein